jgi:3-oxoacyl-[acyl-carrier-protein] synthase II
MHALSTRNDDPNNFKTYGQRPRWFCLGEGAGALILEEYEHAVAWSKNILKLVVVVCLLMLITLQHIQKDWGLKMLNCLRDAGLKPTDVDGVNMHGTSTPWRFSRIKSN